MLKALAPLVLLLAACSSSSSKPVAAPASPSPSEGPAVPSTAQEQGLAGLKQVALAEESYLTDHDKYLAFGGTVPAALAKELPAGTELFPKAVAYGATVRAKSASYCVVAVLRGSALSIAYDSAVGKVGPVSAAAQDCQVLSAQVHTKVG